MLKKATFLGGPLAGEEKLVDSGTDLLYFPHYDPVSVSPNYKDEIERQEFEIVWYRRDAVKKNLFRVDD